MAHILITDSDSVLMPTMASYLAWLGLGVDTEDDSSRVMARLMSKKYDFLICSELAYPLDGYTLCKMIRASGQKNLKNMNIMFVAPEEPEIDKSLFLKKERIYFMNKYENASVWHEKINMILGR
ncbi:MAG: hypothetical protein ISS91_01085 [Candidatus Omnitrophica bacterium]|nr:hypothetical protein [Candidatus Omnitrophota bacterium]